MVGAIADNATYNGTPLGFSLETQTKPVYSAVRSSNTIAHELAHQWFGDSVSVHTWDNIWLNEGFASFSEFLWAEFTGLRTAHEQFLIDYSRPATSAFWQIVVSDPQRDTMFASAVYRRGGMTLQALREKIGDDAFFRILEDVDGQVPLRHGDHRGLHRALRSGSPDRTWTRSSTSGWTCRRSPPPGDAERPARRSGALHPPSRPEWSESPDSSCCSWICSWRSVSSLNGPS